jgi:hypothetical protein
MVEEDAQDLSLHDDNGVEQVYAPEVLRDSTASSALFEVTYRYRQQFNNYIVLSIDDDE